MDGKHLTVTKKGDREMTVETTRTEIEEPERAKPQSAATLTLPAAQDQGGPAQHWQKMLALLVWVTLIGAYVVYTRSNNLGPLAAMRQIIDVMQASLWGPLIYIAVYAARPLIFFSATLLTLAGGFIFGPVYGVLYTIVASNLSAMVAYGMGRYFGEGFLDVDNLGSVIQHYAARMRKNSFETVIIMRFIFLPYDLVSYVAGLLRVDWKAFLLATVVGCLPGTIAFVLAGASIEGAFDGGIPSVDPAVLAVSGVIFVVSLVLSRLFKRREADV